MLALSTWPPSGRPWARLAPSSVCAFTGSPPSPLPLRLALWKLPALSVNPIGLAARWSCHWLTKKNTWVAFCFLFTFHDPGLFGFHEHGYGVSQNDTFFRWNGCSL